MHRFVRKLITEWRRLKLPCAGENVIVAVSGGADSTALLLVLAELRDRKKLHHKFVVAHFNHKLRGKDSNTDEQFVEKLAKERGFDFVSGSGNLSGKSDLEQRARNERYEFLIRAAKANEAKVVLTAHTINDQAETFLLNLIRGSGIDGLRAMPSKRPLGDALLVRPLLSWAKREDTESFCFENDVKFRRDRMNDDLDFTRVKVRKEILPKVAAINPKIVETLARTAELIASAGSRNVLGPQNDTCEALKLNALKNLNENEINTQVRTWLRDRRGDLRGITLKHIDAIVRLANSPKSGRVVELPGGGRVVKGGGELAFRHIKLEY